MRRKNKSLPTVIDLFSGCGGLSRGFMEAGYKILAGVDSDAAALETFSKNHGDSQARRVDLSSQAAITKIKELSYGRSIDVLIAGPPCQGFSLTGPRNFNDRRNSLYLAIFRVVNEIMPKAFLIENVPGLATLYQGQIKDEIIKRFDKIGYSVSCNVLCAADYGIPQMRKRVFFVGLLKDLGIYEFPEPTYTPEKYVTCEEAIGDLPGRENELGEEVDYYQHNPMTPYQRKMRGNCRKLYNHVATNHKDFVKEVIALVPEGGNYKDLPEGIGEHRRFNEAWTRYHSKKPSRTIDTGHRNHFHYRYNRVPTIRENARLQSFSDSFIFYGTRTQQNRQVGNAVPPLLGYHIARKLLRYIGSDRCVR